MVTGVYFSGTGNSKYCVERFLETYTDTYTIVSIEEKGAAEQTMESDEIVFGYPVYFSSIPKILYEYIVSNKTIWNGKKIFIIATMGLFSGDGAGMLARLLKKYGAVIIGGLHVKMPDCIADEKMLKRSDQADRELIHRADDKIKKAVVNIRNGKPQREGLNVWYHIAGLFGQRLYFGYKTKQYTNQLKIDHNKCIGCGLCEKVCPMKNLQIQSNAAVSGNRCTMCYRCINRCPKQAITLLGKTVIKQYDINRIQGLWKEDIYET